MIALDFELHQGDFTLVARHELAGRVTVLFGPSGSGKTTILDAIAGLRRPRSGRIDLNGRTLFDAQAGVDLPPHHRRLGYVPQDIALFPHMNVRRNVLYGRRPGQKLALETVASMLQIGTLLDREITGLSGGEKQRVALARALMSAPELLLLDEPLAAVDLELRRKILPDLETVRDELGVPIVYVTHDREEARRFGDEVVVLANGRIAAAGPASEASI